ncbi:hypothetical protein HPB52_004139 [Rhipicephalus sanguineus]|uniref:Uncharacterized protein n=1 Tax=Rhipicephalus sanguineus TaxID=34632 RepID=A0A9D4QKR0_RHISA|nr:hypothetical protein HPB52_004139 [Rhipicephalus sanguineus]
MGIRDENIEEAAVPIPEDVIEELEALRGPPPKPPNSVAYSGLVYVAMAAALQETMVHTPEQVEEFVTRIKGLVSQKRQGLWSSVVPQMYQGQYQESVPKNWLEIIKNSGAVCVDG